MNQLTFSISETSLLLNMPIDTIRYYDKIGLVVPSKNPLNNYREYTLDHLIDLDYIKLLRDIDVPIKDIKTILLENYEGQFHILSKHHQLLLSKIQMLQKMESTLHHLLENAQQMPTALNTYSCSYYQGRYFKKIETLYYANGRHYPPLKKKLLVEAQTLPDILNKLYFIIEAPPTNCTPDVEFCLQSYLEVDNQSTYDLYVPPSHYLHKTLKTTNTSFQRNYLEALDWIAQQNIIIKGPILLSFLDTPFYFQKYDESLFKLQMPYALS